jgi:SAM-dependent methyltransferase
LSDVFGEEDFVGEEVFCSLIRLLVVAESSRIVMLCLRIFARLSRYVRWLSLKLIALIPFRFVLGRAIADSFLIDLGNLIFPREYDDEIFLSYDNYIRAFPGDLTTYKDLLDSRDWLIEKKILDLGAGLGQFSRALLEAGATHVTALEYQRDKAAFAESILEPFAERAKVICGSAYGIPVETSSLDTVFSHTVFEHLSDPPTALREVARVLKPDGICVLSFNFFHNQGGHHLFPYIHFPWAPWVVNEHSLCRYWSQKLAQDQAAGKARFFRSGCRIESLSDGEEIQLNKISFIEFEQMLQSSGLIVEEIWPSDAFARLFPWLLRVSPINKYVTETVYYILRKPSKLEALM